MQQWPDEATPSRFRREELGDPNERRRTTGVGREPFPPVGRDASRLSVEQPQRDQSLNRRTLHRATRLDGLQDEQFFVCEPCHRLQIHHRTCAIWLESIGLYRPKEPLAWSIREAMAVAGSDSGLEPARRPT